MNAQKEFEAMLAKDDQWCRQLGFSDFEGLNHIIRKGHSVQLVNLCEARHENMCSTIANEIVSRGKVKVVLLAGPSSSGKTSTSLRISLQCKVHGLNPIPIELDNYFVDREQTPRLPNGEYDYECLEAMDIALLNSQLNDLIAGKEVVIPRFDFKQGRKFYDGKALSLKGNDILILEGIHALDPGLTVHIDEEVKFRIFVSDVSATSTYDPRIRPTDNRLLRRIVRDFRTRGISPEQNILRWSSVRAGEEKYIFPFQQYADAIFNSTLQYELPLLKYFVTSPLKEIKESSNAYPTAKRLLDFLENIDPLPLEAVMAIPSTSLMKEFIGWQTLSHNLDLV